MFREQAAPAAEQPVLESIIVMSHPTSIDAAAVAAALLFPLLRENLVRPVGEN